MDSYSAQPTRAMPDQESASRMTEGQSGGMKVESVSIRQAANGGFIVTCHKVPRVQGKDFVPGESKDYAFGSLEEAAAYMAQEFGRSPAAEPRAMAPEPVEASELMA
jgi:uncharacterized protein (DUF1810 family)